MEEVCSDITHSANQQVEFNGNEVANKAEVIVETEEMTNDDIDLNTVVCSHCNEIFEDRETCEQHINTAHSSEGCEEELHDNKSKAIACDVCGKIFSTLANLKIHQRIHNKVRPYSCKKCAKTFTQLGNLQTHQFTHEDQKPFACDVCLRTFTQAGNVKKHREVLHGHLPHLKCATCHETFPSMTKLSMHAIDHIGDEASAKDDVRKMQKFIGTSRGKRKDCYDVDDSLTEVVPFRKLPASNVTLKSDVIMPSDKDEYPPFKRDRVKKEKTKSTVTTPLITKYYAENKVRNPNSKSHYCKICKRGFGSHYDLSRHYSSHAAK